ncbi:NYN domain-containing protein [Patescibacteria group bacterium]
MLKEENNLAFVDGQNLYLGTTKSKNRWKVDLAKFRIYLNKKYKVDKAYYFLGCVNDNYQDLYDEIQEAGFILKFREHNTVMLGKKKGNVDSDIIFFIIEKMYRKEKFDKIILVSGDGDYRKLVDFLIEENRFEKILFPNKKFASSLYKKLSSKYYDHLGNEEIKAKIKKGPLR